MATVNLGSIKFKWKGTYSGATAYTVDDVVEYNGSSYICISNSTGNLPTNATYFEQMSQKGTDGTNGTNGTDLTTTLTTQGDLVYRDGSGLQRLGAGTAGQVLQTGGAGANPSWGTVSSDFVKITSTEITSSTSTITLQQVFDSTYDRYIVTLDGLYPSSTGSNVNVRGMYGVNTIESNAGYHQQQGWHASINSSGSQGSGFIGDWSSYGEFYLTFASGIGQGSGAAHGSIFTIEVAKPSQTTNGKCMHYRSFYRDNNSPARIITAHGGWLWSRTDALTGLYIYGSTFTTGRISVFGFKH